MKVKSPLYSVDARGGFGPGIVFAKAKTTNWARQRLRTPQPKTVAQQVAKNNLVMVVRDWGGVPIGDRQDWDVWGATHPKNDSMGQAYYPSGCNYFTGFGAVAVRAGEGITEEAPVSEAPPLFSNWWWVWWSALGVLRITWAVEGLADKCDFWKTKKLSPGVAPEKRAFYWQVIEDEIVGQVDLTGFHRGFSYGVRTRFLRDNGQYGPWDLRKFDCPL